MAVIPSDIRFVGIGTQVDMTEKKTENLNALTQPYTMQDIIDTVNDGGGGASVMNAGAGLYSIVGSGINNTADGDFSFVGGGNNNNALGICSTIGGGNGNYVVGGRGSSILGGTYNRVSGGFYSTITGGSQNCNYASGSSVFGFRNYNNGYYNTISGGCNNYTCNTRYSSIGNGRFNTIRCGSRNSIFGGEDHFIGPNNNFASCDSFIGGGDGNTILGGLDSNILGGGSNFISRFSAGTVVSGNIIGSNNRVAENYSITIGRALTADVTCYTFVNNLCNVGGGTSDARLKENIQPLTFGLQELSQLEPVEYNFTADESKKTKYGFLAQNVQSVMPSLITYHPTDLVDGEPVLQFDKDAVWSSMVNALKELQERVVKLENK